MGMKIAKDECVSHVCGITIFFQSQQLDYESEETRVTFYASHCHLIFNLT
jgi:hypothetical protein